MENENINQQLEQQGTISKKSRGIFTKKLILITGIVVAILIIFLTAFTLLSAPKKQTPDAKIPTSTSSASLAFLSDTLELTKPTDEITTDFIVDTNTIPVKGLLLYLEYDPQYIEIKKFNLNNIESSFFGFYAQLVQLGLNEPPHKTTVSIVLPEDEAPKSGKGSIGSFTFEVKNLNPGDSTSINISPDSSFITSDGSVIPYTVKPLSITFPLSPTTNPNLAPDAQQRLQQQQELAQ